MKELSLGETEQKALTGVLYNHIAFGTTMEVFGELTREGIERLHSLRKIFKNLLNHLSLADKLSEENYLLLGIPEDIQTSSLEEWSKNDQNKHLQSRALYFLHKLPKSNPHFMNPPKNRFPKEIRIGSRTVGFDHPTYFIAEIGANFDGNLEKAKRLMVEAKNAGADTAKFQSFLSKKIVSGRGFSKMTLKGVHGTWQRGVDEVFADAELPREWHKELFEYGKEIGIPFSSAPYDFEAVDLLDEIGVDYFKIGSGEITWHEMLEYVAKKGKPVMLSTGDSTLAEVDEAIRVIEGTGNRNLILLQCITNYPSKIESANINVLKTYQTAFDIITGYSDHSPGDIVPLAAVVLGARVIEKHFTMSKKDKGPDHPHSMEPHEFREKVEKIRSLETALGTTRKEVVEEESETVIVQRRALYANRDIMKGQILTREDIIELRPALGILPKYKALVIGRTAKIDIPAGEPIYWESLV